MAEEGEPEGGEVPQARAKASAGRSLEIMAPPEVAMETMVDKLKVMNYEKEWCRKKKPFKKPLTRQYFAVPLPTGNQAEQFFHFTSLSAWLLALAGVEFPTPKEFDDPNKICGDLLAAVKKLGFAPPSYPAMKLTSGHGKEVCGILDGLVDYVLEKKGYQYKKPIYLPDGYAEDGADEVDDEGGDMDGEVDTFTLPEYAEQEDEEQAYMEMGIMAPPPGAGGGNAKTDAGGDAADKEMLVSKVDPHLWKMELERVGPKLRILLNADAKDWRTNLEEVQSNSQSIAKAWPESRVVLEKMQLLACCRGGRVQQPQSIAKAWPESRVVLEKMQSELNNSLEKLTTREKFLNEQFERLMQQYRAQKEQLQGAQSTYNKHTEAISDRNNELHRISEQLTEMKGLMEERGSNISDATPVVRIKGAIQKLGAELHEMEVRIGVVSHTLLQLSMKNRRALHAQAAESLSDEDDTRQVLLGVSSAAVVLPLMAGVAPAQAGFKKELKKKKLEDSDFTPSDNVGLRIYEAEVGGGQEIKQGDRVLVHFDVMFRGLDVVSSRSSRLLGANRTIAEPFEFVVGEKVDSIAAKQMSDSSGGLFSGQGGPKPPPALSRAAIGMRRGGKRIILVDDPALGYGAKGVMELPGGATFQMRVEVLDVLKVA
ncbi:hypothetical protein FOA52_014973 [Chlamydomonas sp. UWO 241]|nr:hypothetical protein FOA52_014973 [Chlamydomonas sp. UWO 241]